MSPGGSRVEGEGLRHQFVRPLEVGLGVRARAHIDRQVEPEGQGCQGVDIVGIDAERLLAERVTCIRRLADISAFLRGGITLESQILGVGIRRRRSFQTGGLDLGELDVHRSRQPRDDLVLHLQ